MWKKKKETVVLCGRATPQRMGTVRSLDVVRIIYGVLVVIQRIAEADLDTGRLIENSPFETMRFD